MKQILKIAVIILFTYSCGSENKNQLYKNEDLINKTQTELRLLRNEILARHGYIFKSEDLKEHFSQQNWYKPLYKNVDSLLTENDKINIQLILKYEKQIEINTIVKEEPKVVPKTPIIVNNPIIVEPEFLTTLINKKELVGEMLTFFKLQDSIFNEYKISIVDSFDTLLNDVHYKYLKYEINGHGIRPGKKYGFRAIANKVAVYSRRVDQYKTIYETIVFQPECGTPDYFIKGLDIVIMNNTEFIILNHHTHILGCCGASDVLIDSLIFLRKPNHDYFGAFEFSYVDYNNDYCSGTGDTIFRKTRLDLRSDPAIITTTKYQKKITDTSEVITKYFTFSEEKLKEVKK